MLYLANYGLNEFHNWFRVPIQGPSLLVGHAYDTPEGDLLVVAETRPRSIICDVRARIAPGQIKSIDVSRMLLGVPHHVAPVTAHEMANLGIPTIGNTQLQIASLQVSGAGYLAHFRSRLVGDPEIQGLVADLWVLFYPGVAYSQARLRLTNSSPAIPNLDHTVLPRDLVLTIGTANVAVVGRPMTGNVVLPAGTRFGDGQAIVLPMVCIWQSLAKPSSYSEAGALLDLAIGGNGTTGPWPGFNGYPRLPAGYSKLAFHWRHFRPLLSIVGTWEAGKDIGIPAVSGITGAQADQVFVGGECSGPEGCGMEWIYYLASLTWAHRPCHHREIDGRPLQMSEHPDLRLWDGRAHWHRGVSPDQLGKERSATVDDMTGRWWGPDVEHWLLNTLAIANRIVWCPALQSLLDDQATVYLGQYTVQPGLSTSSPYAARSIGWECIGVSHLLESGLPTNLRTAVANRLQDRLLSVIMPMVEASDDIWDIRIDDPRLGQGAWWMPWQAAVGAYGLFMAGSLFGMPDVEIGAMRAARRVVEDAWKLDGETWLSAPVRPVDTGTDSDPDMAAARAYVHEDCGIPLPATDSPPLFDGSFNDFGMPLAVWVVRQQEPDPSDLRGIAIRQKADAIWAQLQRDTRGGSKWFPPEGR